VDELGGPLKHQPSVGSREAVRYRQAVEPAVATVVESRRRLAAAAVELHRLGSRLVSDEAESQ
jgi:hypothetical protein